MQAPQGAVPAPCTLRLLPPPPTHQREGLPTNFRKQEPNPELGAGAATAGAARAGSGWLARLPGASGFGGALAPECRLYAPPRLVYLLSRGKRRPPCTRNNKARNGARASGAPSNGPGREFHGDWGADPPHLHPCPPALPPCPTQPAAALPPRPLRPPRLPTVTPSGGPGRGRRARGERRRGICSPGPAAVCVAGRGPDRRAGECRGPLAGAGDGGTTWASR